MQSEIILLSNVKQENVASLVQKEFEMFGITGIKGKRIDAEQSAIHTNVAQALAEYNVIMVIGGMGEAENNMTVSAVASAIGFGTVQKDGELFPAGAEIFRNRDKKPSGCAISQGNQCIIMLPGDTETLQFMLCYRVSRYLAEFIGGAHSLKTLRAKGINKANAEEAVAQSETEGTAVRVFEDKGEIAVQIYAKGSDRKEAAAKVSSALKNIAGKLGSAAYAVDAENVGQAFGKELSKKDLTVAIAAEGISREEIAEKAYTGEFVGNYLGSSQGVQKYNIPEKLLQRHGANSTWTAAVLAGEVAKTYGANIGIAITADEVKASEGANIAVCMGDNLWTEFVTAENREELIEAACARAIHLARSVAFAYPKLYENSASLMGAVSGKSKFKTAKSEAGTPKWYSRFIPMKGDSKNDLIRKIVFLICVAVFIGSMGFLSTKMFDGKNQDTLANDVSTSVDINNFTEEDMEAAKEWGYNPKLYKLYQQNPDTIGYIKIDNTNVDFPVVQTIKANEKGLTGQYYLRKDFNGNKSTYGTPFLDYRCQANPDRQSTNLIIYGHNVYDDGRMFSDLIKYRKLSFYKEHPVIHFDTLYGDQDWLVVGVILTNAYEKDGPVWNYNNFITGDAQGTKEFLEQVAKRTMVVTGVDYNTDDDFLTLSTCSYDFTDARVVIIAREVRAGEDISNLDTSKAYYNANPLMPDKWYQAVSEAQQSESDASFGDAEQIEDLQEIEYLDILRFPRKLEYKVGESFDPSGLVLEAYYPDGSVEEVTSGYKVNPSTAFTEAGTHYVEITYRNASVTIDVEVLPADSTSASTSSDSSSDIAITSIAVLKSPSKLEYNLGESLSLSGLTLRVYKSDDSKEDVSDLGKISSSPADGSILNTAGQQSVTVSYEGFSASFTVNVKDPNAVTSVEIASKPSKLTYKAGDKLDLSGLTLKVTKGDGSFETVSSGFTASPAGGSVLSTVGETTVTVSYGGKSTSFSVTVEAASSAPESTGSSSVPESSGNTSGSSSSGSSGNSSNSESSEGTSSDPVVLPPSSSESGSESGSVEGSSNVSSSSLGKSVSTYYEDSLTDTVRINGKKMSVFDAVCQIVAYEAGYGQPDEHVKAQAVASYTYLMNGGGDIDAGVKTTVTDQIKRNVAAVIGYAVLDDRSDDYILAVYFSESCGETADAEWVWGYANRNLKSVKSSVDGKESKTYRISSDDFADKVEAKAGISLSGDPSDWIEIKSYWGSTDYVNKISLGGKSYTGRKLRETILGNSNLRSTAFDVTYDEDEDEFVFTMRGYGHGVGLSAKGSIAYAKKGWTWDEILLKYYSNCYIDMKY